MTAAGRVVLVLHLHVLPQGRTGTARRPAATAAAPDRPMNGPAPVPPPRPGRFHLDPARLPSAGVASAQEMTMSFLVIVRPKAACAPSRVRRPVAGDGPRCAGVGRVVMTPTGPTDSTRRP